MKLKKNVSNTNFSNNEEFEELMESYKEAFMELKMEISELRKQEKNPIIPEGLLRSIPSKIKYAENSLSQKDCEVIERLFEDVVSEIEYCKKEEILNVRKEIDKIFKSEDSTESKEVSDGAIQEEKG